MQILRPEKTTVIEQNYRRVKELDRAIQDDLEIVNNENEETAVQERACERITENVAKRNALNSLFY